jgi:hypothetical protein
MGLPAPLLIGAGLGAAGSLMKGGNPIQGAALGGALGGMGGELIPALQGAGQASAASAGSQAAQAAGGAMMTPTMPLDAYAPSLLTGTAPAAYNAASMMPLIAQSPVSGGLAATQTAAPSFFDGMSDFMTPQNLMGASNMMGQESQAPQMSAPGGGVRGGNANVGETVEAFLRRLGAKAQGPNSRQGLFY